MTGTTPTPDLAPVVKRVSVPGDPATAFRAFTEEMGEWWPLATHSVGGEQATGVHFGAAVGEPIVELLADGTAVPWGTVTAWDPPRRVAFTWHPGTDRATATHVDVRFTATGDHTTVDLVHSEWERRPDGPEMRDAYDGGWDLVVARYVDHGEARRNALPASVRVPPEPRG